MKKTLLIGLLLYNISTLQAQELFFHSGKNLTSYDFKDNINSIVNLQKGIGYNYEVGFFSYHKNNNPLFYSVSAVINEYNATGSTTGAAMEWKTNYLGVKGAFYYKVINGKSSNLALKIGFGAETIVYGRQKINFDQLELTTQKEFSGIFAGPGLGILYSYEINKGFGLQLGYNFDKHFSLTNQSQEKLNFNNHSLNVGFSVTID
jgi:hypothetical protein